MNDVVLSSSKTFDFKASPLKSWSPVLVPEVFHRTVCCASVIYLASVVSDISEVSKTTVPTLPFTEAILLTSAPVSIPLSFVLSAEVIIAPLQALVISL